MKKFLLYYNSLSILKKFLLPSIFGIISFFILYIYIFFNTSEMKDNIHKINIHLVPIYETIFDNDILLEKITNELNSAVIAHELEWIENTKLFAKKIRSNLDKFKNSPFKDEINEIKISFEDYYKSATTLSFELINNEDNYDVIYKQTTYVVAKYKHLVKSSENLKLRVKKLIKNNINDTYSISSLVATNGSYLFISWVILSTIAIIYIYKDMKSRISQIVNESEFIALGDANFHKRLNYISSDELGGIVDSINSFIDKLDKNHQELNSVKNDIKRFIADTVHQIRTPLANIRINAEMMGEVQKDDSSKIFIDQINASISMLSNSYEDLSYITSYDTIKYKPSKVSITNLLNKRIEFFKTICELNLKEIESNIEPELFIYINEIECERIIDNNISNAVKYAQIEKPFFINLFKDNETNSIIMEFKSYGKEIEDKKRIFEKDYRENKSKRGLGLGLNMVKNICNKYEITFDVSYKDNHNIFTYAIKEIT